MHFNMRSYGARAFAISALEFWNQLPNDIKSIDNLTTFKSKLKAVMYVNAMPVLGMTGN